MKRIILIIFAVMLAGTAATARQAAIQVSASGIKSTVIPEDEEVMKACPLLAGGSVTYKDEADLEVKINQIEEYFVDHKLSKTYKLTFWDKDTKNVVGEVTIGRGARKPATGSETKDHLLMGILASAAALGFLLLFLLVSRARKGGLLSALFEGLFLLCAVASGILAIILLATLGLKIILAVLGTTGFLAILLLIFLSSGHTQEWRENERRKAEEREYIDEIKSQNPGQEGYTVRGRYFPTLLSARRYAESIGASYDEIVEWKKNRP